jgi:hypothetical protein
MKKNRYSMAFTTGGLFSQESVNMAALYLEMRDWDKVREKAVSENLLQARTSSSLQRVCREVVSRLETLRGAELELLVDAAPREQGYLLWIAVCRRYPFIADFAVEVIRERYMTLKTDLNYEDFDAFFNGKAVWRTELERIQPSTRNKLRQVLFKMLREADLLTKNNAIVPAMPSPAFLKTIQQEGRRDALLFPVFESDIG